MKRAYVELVPDKDKFQKGDGWFSKTEWVTPIESARGTLIPGRGYLRPINLAEKGEQLYRKVIHQHLDGRPQEIKYEPVEVEALLTSTVDGIKEMINTFEIQKNELARLRDENERLEAEIQDLEWFKEGRKLMDIRLTEHRETIKELSQSLVTMKQENERLKEKIGLMQTDSTQMNLGLLEQKYLERFSKEAAQHSLEKLDREEAKDAALPLEWVPYVHGVTDIPERAFTRTRGVRPLGVDIRKEWPSLDSRESYWKEHVISFIIPPDPIAPAVDECEEAWKLYAKDHPNLDYLIEEEVFKSGWHAAQKAVKK